MFYHIKISQPGIISWFENNLAKEELLFNYICPFINKEIIVFDGRIHNLNSFGNFTIFMTEAPITSDWPIKKPSDKNNISADLDYEHGVEDYLYDNNCHITEDIYKEALHLIDIGKYNDSKIKHIENFKNNYCFFICPLNEKEIEHNYEFVIKPLVNKYQIKIEKADDINHTNSINEVILKSIQTSFFVIADLSFERPNCYYEVGYAHSLGKPVIIIAKEGTKRHFDISNYKWNYWNDYIDLKPKLEKEVDTLIKKLRKRFIK